MAYAFAHSAAQVSHLPTAPVTPIHNARWRGRYPRNVTSLRRYKMQREWRLHYEAQQPPPPAARTPAQELEYASDMLASFTHLRAEALQRYRSAQQQQAQTNAVHHGATLYHLPTYRTGARHV